MEENNNKQKEINIEVTEDGPLNITGSIIFKDLKRDVTVEMDGVSLCLCGRSRNKPYCDDSHLSRTEE